MAMSLNKNTVRRSIERLREYEAGRRKSPYAGETVPPQSVPAYEPTLEKIAKEKAKLRASWTGGDTMEGFGVDGPGIRQHACEGLDAIGTR
jgi:hypothetical protein